MDLSEIYTAFIPGSDGFATAVSDHCGFGASRDEIKRIAKQAATADEFQRVWQEQDWWTDDNQAAA